MKITTKQTVEVETEITLPAYYKSPAFYFKIYSEENCICVLDDEISIRHSRLPFILDVEKCTEKEFLKACTKTLSYFKKLV